MSELAPWSIDAVNLAEHASNAIHTDEGARAAGFDSALVAGVTVFAYMTHVPVAAWGLDWLSGGGGQVRFRHPVLDGDQVDFVPVSDGSAIGHYAGTIEAQVGGALRATLDVQHVGAVPAKCTGRGDALEPMSFVADDEWAGYAMRAGDDLAIYDDRSVVHPVSWQRVANNFFHTQIVTGSWIHVRSDFVHHATAPWGATIDATAVIVERFDSRAGERAILDVRISADGRPVAIYEHEAIIDLA